MTAIVGSTPERIQKLVDEINQQVKECAARIIADAPGKEQPFIKGLYDRAYHYLTDGGKRCHAQTVMLAYRAVGGREHSAILQVASGFQFYHHYTMVHDDVYDDDKNRRNRPTDHEVFRRHFVNEGNAHDQQKAQKIVDNPLFSGNAERKAAVAALVYGKIIHAFAFESLLAAPFEKEKLYAVMRMFNWHEFYDNAGQMRDVLLEGETVVDPEDCLQTAYFKSGREYHACATAGAILGGATASQLEALQEWAACFGTAYQLQDDLEDLEPDSEKGRGRGVGADIITRKPTYLLMMALRQAKAKDKEILTGWLNHNGTDNADMNRVMESVRNSGAVETCRAKVAAYLEQGANALRNAEPRLDKEVVDQFDELTRYIFSRTYWKRALPETLSVVG